MSRKKSYGFILSSCILILVLLVVVLIMRCGHRNDSNFSIYESISLTSRQFDARGNLTVILANNSEYTLEYLIYRDFSLDMLIDEEWVPIPEREDFERTAICHYVTIFPREYREVIYSLRSYHVEEAGRYRFRLALAVEDRTRMPYVRIGRSRRYMHEVILAEFDVHLVGDGNGGWEVELVE